MLHLRKVAITGGLACGKSSVCRFLRQFGAYVVSADEISHQLLSPKTHLGQQVILLLGSDIVVEDKIDRKIVAKKVFNNINLLNSLETLLHPEIFKEIEKQYQSVLEQIDNKKNGSHVKLFVAEVPLLYEAFAENSFDFVVAVVANQQDCKERFMKSTGYDDNEYHRRMTRQLNPMLKATKAQYRIENSGNMDHLRTETLNFFNFIIAENNH